MFDRTRQPPQSLEPRTSSPTSKDAGGPILSPVGGGVLGPFLNRSAALPADQTWLETNWLGRTGRQRVSVFFSPPLEI